MKKVIVCELGFSSLKWMYGGAKGRITSAYQRNGSDMTIGQDSLLLAGSSYLRTPAELVQHYPAFVRQAYVDARVTADDHVLVVGLPYQFWLQEQEKAQSGGESAIRDLIQTLGVGNIRRVIVLPQGLGGIKSFIHDHPGVKGNVLVVDIGFNTVIYALYNIETSKIVYGDTLYKKGLHQMATRILLPAIAKKAPARSFTPVEIALLIERGFIQYGMDKIDIQTEIRQAAGQYMNDTIGEIMAELQGNLGQAASFDNVVFFGGGSHLIGQVPSNKVRVTIATEPEFANARGFNLIASAILAGE